jgi:predicted regulator of Ras-like GTPase activity (Roadblock/LC7/MglB family)
VIVTSPFLGLLDELARHRGVRGGLVVSERDGLVIDAHVHLGVRAAVVAALAASIYRKARVSAEAAGMGGVTYVELAAEHGRLCMAGRGDLVVVVVTDARATAGRLRAVLLRELEGLS